jgi:hypothetical protein
MSLRVLVSHCEFDESSGSLGAMRDSPSRFYVLKDLEYRALIALVAAPKNLILRILETTKTLRAMDAFSKFMIMICFDNKKFSEEYQKSLIKFFTNHSDNLTLPLLKAFYDFMLIPDNFLNDRVSLFFLLI